MPITRDEQKELVSLIVREKEAQKFYDGVVQWHALEKKLDAAVADHDQASVALFRFIEGLVE